MREDQDFDVQPADETDPYTDPDFIRWSAREEGASDQSKGIGMRDGFRKLRDRGASQAEIKAYLYGHHRAALLAIARDSEVAEHCEVA